MNTKAWYLSYFRGCLPYSNDGNILQWECTYGTYGSYLYIYLFLINLFYFGFWRFKCFVFLIIHLPLHFLIPLSLSFPRRLFLSHSLCRIHGGLADQDLPVPAPLRYCFLASHLCSKVSLPWKNQKDFIHSVKYEELALPVNLRFLHICDMVDNVK